MNRCLLPVALDDRLRGEDFKLGNLGGGVASGRSTRIQPFQDRLVVNAVFVKQFAASVRDLTESTWSETGFLREPPN